MGNKDQIVSVTMKAYSKRLLGQIFRSESEKKITRDTYNKVFDEVEDAIYFTVKTPLQC